jgi:hypothetical protein
MPTNRLSLAPVYRLELRGIAENGPEFRYQSATDPLPLGYQFGILGLLQETAESVVTNQPLYQLSYAGSLSTRHRQPATSTPATLRALTC